MNIDRCKLGLKIFLTFFSLFLLFGANHFNAHPEEVRYFGLTMFVTGIAFTFISFWAVSVHFRIEEIFVEEISRM